MPGRRRLPVVAKIGLAGAALGVALLGLNLAGLPWGTAAETVASIEPADTTPTIEQLLGMGLDHEPVGAVEAPVTSTAQVAIGPVSKLPLPRFVSLKSERINVRRGPSRQQDLLWTFQRRGWPVEVTAEFENWRRIRDSDGQEGWVQQTMLIGTRTASVAPWSDEQGHALRRDADPQSRVVAMLQPGVMAEVKHCDGNWCRIEGHDFDGYLRQTELWGVYPGEIVED